MLLTRDRYAPPPSSSTPTRLPFVQRWEPSSSSNDSYQPSELPTRCLVTTLPDVEPFFPPYPFLFASIFFFHFFHTASRGLNERFGWYVDMTVQYGELQYWFGIVNYVNYVTYRGLCIDCLVLCYYAGVGFHFLLFFLPDEFPNGCGCFSPGNVFLSEHVLLFPFCCTLYFYLCICGLVDGTKGLYLLSFFFFNG